MLEVRNKAQNRKLVVMIVVDFECPSSELLVFLGIVPVMSKKQLSLLIAQGRIFPSVLIICRQQLNLPFDF